VWANYLSNAIKYGGSPPHIELGGVAQDDGMVRFWVRDNGPGIAEDMMDKIFSPSFTTKTSGMGLGLALVRSIIREAGGEINFESSAAKGTIFEIRLPSYDQ
jgi:signal transduction histidine kinase